MADETAQPRTYDLETEYAVKFVRPVRYRGATLDALNEHDMSGLVLGIIIEQEGDDVVDRAEPR